MIAEGIDRQLRDVFLTAEDLRSAVARYEHQARDAQDERVYRWLVGQHRLSVLRESTNEEDDRVSSANR